MPAGLIHHQHHVLQQHHYLEQVRALCHSPRVLRGRSGTDAAGVLPQRLCSHLHRCRCQQWGRCTSRSPHGGLFFSTLLLTCLGLPRSQQGNTAAPCRACMIIARPLTVYKAPTCSWTALYIRLEPAVGNHDHQRRGKSVVSTEPGPDLGTTTTWTRSYSSSSGGSSRRKRRGGEGESKHRRHQGR